MSTSSLQSFFHLDPPSILNFVEDFGEEATGQIYQLNSYENRVYDIFLESGERWVTKFYRPQRWSKKTIQEEHDFCFEIEQSIFRKR